MYVSSASHMGSSTDQTRQEALMRYTRHTRRMPKASRTALNTSSLPTPVRHVAAGHIRVIANSGAGNSVVGCGITDRWAAEEASVHLVEQGH